MKNHLELDCVQFMHIILYNLYIILEQFATIDSGPADGSNAIPC